MKSSILIAIIAGMFLLLGLTLWGIKSSITNDIPNQVSASLEIPNQSQSWGQIDYDGGVKTSRFAITNHGQQPIMLSDLRTSCMCTTATISNDEITSPSVRMVNNGDWQISLLPSQTAWVEVSFDPTYHGIQGLGDIKRIVTVHTNATGYENLEFSVDGQVIKN